MSYLRWVDNSIVVNGNPAYTGDRLLDETFVEVYRHFGISYPKFFKMDRLSKAGFLAVELLLANNGHPEKLPSGSALVFSNRSASLDTDRRYYSEITAAGGYFPSPSLFVYTLPNIVQGEIAIRHQVKGENLFLVSDKFDPATMHRSVSLLLDQSTTGTALCGWVDVEDNRCDILVYIVKKGNFKSQPETALHNAETLEKLYKTSLWK